MSSDIIELRLPLKREYLPLLRATMGVVAGSLSFRYDEIMQLRVAVAEVFDLVIDHVTRRGRSAEENELEVRFAVQPDRIEILITVPNDYTASLDSEEGKESYALLKSLTDRVEFGIDVAGKSGVRMVKYKSAEEA